MPAHLKRTRAQGELDTPPAVPTVAPAATRRATRQSSIPPLPPASDPEPRRRRRRTDINGPPVGTSQASRSPRGKENMPVHLHYDHQQLQQPQRQTHAEPLSKPTTRVTRHSALAVTALPPSPARRISSSKHEQGPEKASISHHMSSPRTVARPPALDAQHPTSPSQPAAPKRPRGRPATRKPVVAQQSVPVGRSRPIMMATSIAQAGSPPSAAATNNSGTPNRAGRGADSAGRADRNIDKVVLGDICFRAWYPSYYGKEVLGDFSGSSSTTKDGKGDGKTNTNGATKHHSETRDDANVGRKRDRDGQPILDRLYVCPSCFKYSKELVTWWAHVCWCQRRGHVPGRKIYTHPRGRRTVMVPSGPPLKPGRKRGSVGQKMAEQVVQDEGEWSIWEVDGETDVLFCQNLSLFAKLFLDNKSVFFDVTAFNYFLLVYTPPASPTADNAPPRSQIVGFFSKEKMSWDNNNLACILVFPPWQRKGLGSLLMGVSYEISRREGLLGGPEKPISDLGKKGYKRFWAGEIARWLLSLDLQPQTQDVSSSSSQPQFTTSSGGGGGETVIDIEACSQATWIAAEDCLLVLREMGVAEDAGRGPPPRAQQKQQPTGGGSEEASHGNNNNNNNNNGADTGANNAGASEPALSGAATATATVTTTTTTDAAAASTAAAEHHVQRVRISQRAVRAWVAANKISLERACDPAGFVEGYAVKEGRAVGSEEPV